MPSFYTLLQREDTTRAEALRQVQIEFITGISPEPGGAVSAADETRGRRIVDQVAGEAQIFTGYSHPYFWAPFVLMGNWL